MHKFLLYCSVSLIAAMASTATMAAESKMSDDFVKKAAMSDKFEIESSQLALEKSKNSNVKGFAQQMIEDHTASSNALKSALGSSEVDPALTDAPLDAKHQAILHRLTTSSGKAFDTAYVAGQRDGHGEAVKLFRAYARKGDDAFLKSFAQTTLPVLEQHKKHVAGLRPASK